MVFMTAQPDTLAAAAGKLAGIGSPIAAAKNAAAVTPTSGVVPAAADEISARAAAQFAAHAQLYQTVSVLAAAIDQQLVATLGASAGSYAVTKPAIAAATN